MPILSISLWINRSIIKILEVIGNKDKEKEWKKDMLLMGASVSSAASGQNFNF